MFALYYAFHVLLTPQHACLTPETLLVLECCTGI